MFNTTRRSFLIASGTGFAIVASGCHTISAKDEGEIYQETIENVMISPKDGRILVAGKEYFYMFEKDQTLEGVLRASFRQAMQASFDTFTLTDSRDIVGAYRILVSSTLTPYQIEEAKRIGFKKDRTGKLVLNATIKGVRFVPEAAQKNLPPSINRPYPVQVKSITSDKSNHRYYPSSVSEVVFVAGLFVLLTVFRN